MIGEKKIEHAVLRVEDLELALDFYTDVFGLTEFDRIDGTAYLGCGYDDRYDLGVTEGGTGVEHFAIRVRNEAVLESYESRLEDAGVFTQRTDGAEPGQDLGVRFQLPSGQAMELVVVDNDQYLHPAFTDHDPPSHAPVDLDHINLMSSDVAADMRFLESNLDFSITEYATESDSDTWVQGFARYGDYHHDVAATLAEDDESTLHHLAWAMRDISHIKDSADSMARAGHQLEIGINRHTVGTSVYTYFWEPGGNRFELGVEMPAIDPDAPPVVHDGRTEQSSLTVWGGVAQPDSWLEGS